MGLLDAIFGNKNKAEQVLKDREKREKTYENFLGIVYGLTDEEFEKEEKEEKEPLSDLYKDIKDYMKKRYNMDIDEDLLNPTALYTTNELERVSRIRKYYIDHTSFNRDAFPEETIVLYFDDVFNDLYENIDSYYDSTTQITERIENYLAEKNIDKCCIKLGHEDFLYYYKNTVDNDAIEYNVSLVDKNNNEKQKFIYEEDNNTYNNSNDLLNVISAEVAYLDLAHDKEYRKIGDIQPSVYASPNLPIMDKIRIKNEILLDLYESKKYKPDCLDVIRDALNRDIDIGYILNPCYSAQQMETILEFVKQNQNETKILHDLRMFSTDIGTQFRKPFSPHEFSYIMVSIINGDITGFSSPEKTAQMKLNFYKDEALNSPSNEVIFNIGEKQFALYKSEEEYPDFFDFRIEELVVENGNVVDRLPVYEMKNDIETGDLNVIMSLLKEKYREKNNEELVNKLIADVIETVTNEDESGHIRLLRAEDGAIIQIEGIRKVADENEIMLATLMGNAGRSEIAKDDAGVTISIIKDGKSEVVYTEDLTLGVQNTLKEALDIIEQHGKLCDYDERLSTPINPEKEYKIQNKLEDLDDLLYEGKYKPTAINNIEEIKKNVILNSKIFIWESSDRQTALEFVPKKDTLDSGEKVEDCNIYMIKDGVKTPLYIHEVTTSEAGDKIEHFSGKIEDVADVIIKNKFELSEHKKNDYQTKTTYYTPKFSQDR